MKIFGEKCSLWRTLHGELWYLAPGISEMKKISHRRKTGPCCAIAAVTEASSDLFLLWSSAAFQHQNGFDGEV